MNTDSLTRRDLASKRDRQTSETSAGETNKYKYDLAGNRMLCDYGGTSRRLESAYNGLNLLTGIDEIEGATTRTSTYAYDLNLNILTLTFPNTAATTKTFDELNRVKQIANAAGIYTQTWGLAGNLLEIVESYPSNPALDRTVTNTYDKIYRLKQELDTPAVAGPAKQTDFEYDAANNRTKRTVGAVVTNYTHNGLDQLTQVAETGQTPVNFGYDLDGNRVSKTQGVQTTTFAYDFDHRLTNVDVSGVDYEYVYDYRTRRVERVEAGVATRVVFGGGVSVLEFTGAVSTPTVEYVRGSGMGGGIGSILYSVRVGLPSYTHYNSRGDVVSKTDDLNVVTYQAAYEAFGEHPAEEGATLDRQKANTKEEDPTGLLNEGMRYRDLETGVFLTRDPLGMVVRV